MIRAGLIALGLAASAAHANPVFEDRSSALPHHVYEGGWEHFVGGGLAVFDCNADTLPDVFAAGGSAPARLIVNTGEFTFTSVNIPELREVTGAYPIDLDADGNKDLFVLRAGANVILKGAGDCTFTDAGHTFGLPADTAWSTAFTAWWEHGAQRPTLAVGNYVDRTDPDGPFEACDDNTILHPESGGYASQTLSPGYCALSILAASNPRGAQMLRLSNDRHYYVSGGHEQMWDIAEQRFLGPADGWLNLSVWGMGIAQHDVNADGIDDVMLTSMGDQLLQFGTQDGGFTAAEYAIGTYAQRPHIGDDGRPSTGWHAEFGDIDNDGRPDLFIAKGNVDQMPGMATRDPNNLLMQQSDGTFRETAAAAGVATTDRSRGAALADFDLDGRLDLIVSNRRAPLEIYRNITPDTGGWVTVDLQQSGGNRDAIGARIRVTAGNISQVIQRTIGGGHAGGQLLPHSFGIGAQDKADIHITWPDGSTTRTTAKANTPVLIRKP